MKQYSKEHLLKLAEGYKNFRKANPNFSPNRGRKFGPCTPSRRRKLVAFWKSKNPKGRRLVRYGAKYAWEIQTPTGRQLEHRVVMQKKLFRKLATGECVHHINGDTLDNHPENLEAYMRHETGGRFGSLNGKWSRHFDQCVKCNSRKYRHASRGLCSSCLCIVRGKTKGIQFDKRRKHENNK